MTGAPSQAAGTLPIVEIFHSPQGEGTRVGEPATFVRLAGCNLRCSWCDTPYSWNAAGVAAAAKMTIDDIARAVGEQAVVITGGEPMLHARRLPALVAALRAGGVSHITVETNATITADGFVDSVDLWSLSPKLPGSGETADPVTIDWFLRHARADMQLKFVIASLPDDWAAMWQLLAAIGEPLDDVPIIVQPDGTVSDYERALRELSELVMDDQGEFNGASRRSRVRVIPQTHRVAWGALARGV